MIEYAVVTSLPQNRLGSIEVHAGNMQPLFDVYQLASEPSEKNSWRGTVRPVNTLILATLSLMVPVFELGEVVIIDFQTQREIAPPHRPLDGYEVTYERFGTAQEALDRSAEVINESRTISKEN